MDTRITRSPRVAAAFLRKGEVVAFPTETVYGLGADAFNSAAVRRIYRAKGRPPDNPLIVHLASVEMVHQVTRTLSRSAERLMSHFFPGPLTLVVPRHPSLPLAVTAGLDTVGIRVPGHPVAEAFLRASGVPVAAPSANRSGRPSPTTWGAARDELDGRISCILQGGASPVGLESTVVDCTGSRLEILRPGAVTLEELRDVVPSVRWRRGDSGEGGQPKSPGMKYRHYAPKPRIMLVDNPADIRVVRGGGTFAYIGINSRGFPEKPALTMICPEVEVYARRLFHFFRDAEKAGVSVIYCQRVSGHGLGQALMDRLRKAAAAPPTSR